MKRADFIKCLACILFATQLVSCNKIDDLFNHHNNGGNGNVVPVLKEMIIGNRHYVFHYNARTEVDSVVVNDPVYHYVYYAFYSGNRLDSASIVLGGVLISVNRNFKYDTRGNIVQYQYFYRQDPQAPPTTYNFAYDDRNRIIEITSTNNFHNKLTYDANNNVIQWNPDINNVLSPSSYTYDDKLNPLYYVKNLFAIFVEEPFIWEYEFSQHNSVTKKFTDKPASVFTNEYNSKDQLVRKTLDYEIFNNANSFVFSYYN